jgi:hypothetical protein
MKISITKEDINGVAALLSVSAMSILNQTVAQLEDKELVAQLREQKLNDYDRIVAYLDRTQLHRDPAASGVRISNSNLWFLFRLSVFALKRVRDRLVTEKKATVRSHNGTIHIFYPRAEPPAFETGLTGIKR